MKPNSQPNIPHAICLPHGAHVPSDRSSASAVHPGPDAVILHAGNAPFRHPVAPNAAMAAGLRSQLSLTQEPHLITAIRMGDGIEFHRLLNTLAVDVNRPSADGMTPLMMTVRKNNLTNMQMLLEFPELDVNAKNQQGNTALHLAAQAGQLDQLNALLDDVRITANVQNMHGISALCLAAQHDRAPVVERLSCYQLLNQRIPENPVEEYLKAYRLAADYGGFNTVLTLLHFRPWLRNSFRSDGHTALTSAIKEGRLDVVQTLLKKYPDLNVNLAGEGLGTALNVAAAQRNAEMVLTLLRHPGLDPNRPVDCICSTALHLAASRGDANIVQALMSALPAIDVNAISQCLDTPLHRAAHCGDVDTLRVLASRVDDINHRDEDGQSVLHFAAGAGNIESVQFLLQLPNVDPLVFSNIGQYPSDIAKQFGHIDVARVLQDAEFQRFIRTTQP